MNKIGYVVKMNGGEYDDAFSFLIGISTDREAALDYASKLQLIYNSIVDKNAEMQEELVMWSAANPCPTEKDVHLEDVPVFKYGEKVSQARQKERMQIMARNNEVVRLAHVAYQEKMDAYFKELKDKRYTEEEKEFMAQEYFDDYMLGEYCLFVVEDVPYI